MIAKKRQKNPASQDGFTIIELMIATGILSTILLIVTIVMISIGNLYYKGVNQARIQDATRTVTDDISQKLQLSGQSLTTAAWPSKNEAAYCIGSTRYTYVVGVELGTPAPHTTSPPTYYHVLWRDTNPNPGSCFIMPIEPDSTPNPSPVDLTNQTPSNDPNGTELVSANSRLTAFCIGAFTAPSTCDTTNTASPYSVLIGMAYGDDDLLCSPSVAGSCASGTAMDNWSKYQDSALMCKTNAHDRFCSTAQLSTTVVQRL